MTLLQHNTQASVAFFGPPSKPPKPDYLDQVRSYIDQKPTLKPLADAIIRLEEVWPLFANANKEIDTLEQGPQYLQALKSWMVGGPSELISAATSGIINLPILVLIHVAQYFQFLELQCISHADFLHQVRGAGGIQGNCGGLFAASAVACAIDEEEVVRNATVLLRFVVGIGAYGEIGDDSTTPGTSSIIVRLKREGQAEQLVSRFPGTYISNIANPKLINIVGPVALMEQFQAAAKNESLLIQHIHIRGKLHNPENKDFVQEMCDVCHQNPSLMLPEAGSLQVALRSNENGERITKGSLTTEFIRVTLAGRCDWYTLVHKVAEDLVQSARASHTILNFGIGDCVPKSPFHRHQLHIEMIDAQALIAERLPSIRMSILSSRCSFPEDAIAIIGASCRLPGANHMDELADLLARGIDRHVVLPTDRFDLQKSYRASQAAKFVAERGFYGNFLDRVGRFDHSFFNISKKDAIYVDPQQRILLELAYEAMESSGYFPRRCVMEKRVGCFIGSCIVEYAENTSSHPPNARTTVGTFACFLSGKLSHYFGWNSPSEVIDTACSSSLAAVNRGCKAIQAGECSMALAGGINVLSSLNNFLDLAKSGFLSPSGQSQPFDNAADGYCRSEGGGLVVLKSLKAALEDHDQILGVIPGISANQSGQSASLLRPHKPAQKDLFRDVLRRAELHPNQISYVECHGPGTQAGDPIEIQSVRETFGGPGRPSPLNIGSVKGNLGHSEAAAGITGLLKILAMIKRGLVPPLVNHKTLNTKIAPLEPDNLKIALQLEQWDVPWRIACINSYGASGSNCAALCAEGPPQASSEDQAQNSTTQNASVPIILSALSEDSLSAYKETLASYLCKTVPEPCLRDVAFTLNKLRKRHTCAIGILAHNMPDLIEQLENKNPPLLNSIVSPKRVVLVFSGQSKQHVGLSHAFYSCHAIFRKYIDICDDTLKRLGHSSLFPSIFELNPVTDIVTLQVGLLAMKYACAQSWIDSGLQVDAVLGHSIGELTTLAVSGVLSLFDCIKLCAGRAHLVKERWGTERGVMLAVHAGYDVTQQVIDHYHQSLVTKTYPFSTEIACYNGPRSHVLVGSAKSIANIENIIKVDHRFRAIGFERLNTSHGFHSAFTDPLLHSLAEVSASLTWNKPVIPLESCTQEKLELFTHSRPSSHAREPVYFTDAIRRIERNLGPCAWVESGVGTGITSLVKQALASPEQSSFHPLNTKSPGSVEEIVPQAVFSLWHQAINCTDWNTSQYRSVWLPPYQFRGSDLWLPNIDRGEIQHNHIELESQDQEKQRPSKPPKLVIPLCSGADDAGSRDFSINTSSMRFQNAVIGHAVCGRPCCPAGMYMECATMALQSITPDLDTACLIYEDMKFKVALGIDPTRHVKVRLDKLTADQSWKFNVRSSPINEANSKDTEHASGTISLLPSIDLTIFQRLVSDSVRQLRGNTDVEILKSGRAYRLFSKVVDYESFFCGISSIRIADRQALADIKIPENQPNRDESTVFHICDAMVIDSLVQPAGLIINSNDAIASKDVLIATSFERVSMTQSIGFDSATTWNVYARYEITSESHATGDIFVLTREGLLVMTIVGCHFMKLSIATLTRVLDSSSPDFIQRKQTAMSLSKTTRAIPIGSSQSFPEEIVRDLTGSSTNSFTPPTETEQQHELDLREIISAYTGISNSAIAKDVVMADLGVDSLTVVEMTEELAARFGKEVSSEELSNTTFGGLLNLLIPGSLSMSRGHGSSDQEKPNRTVIENPLLESQPNLDAQQYQALCEILEEYCGPLGSAIEQHKTVGELGIDSLTMVEMKGQLEETFDVRITDDQFSLDSTALDVMKVLRITHPGSRKCWNQEGVACDTATHSSPPEDRLSFRQAEPISTSFRNPSEALVQAESKFHEAATKHGFVEYWSTVSPVQNQLSATYILEAYKTLGIDISKIPAGNAVGPIPCLPKYSRLAQRFLDILEKENIIHQRGQEFLRSERKVYSEPSPILLEQLIVQWPQYETEARMMAMSGSRLGECLSGKVDPMSLFFANPTTSKILDNWYSKAPLLATMTDQLLELIHNMLPSQDFVKGAKLKILEVGAGSGATTQALAEALFATGFPAEYTFTDVAPRLVQKAKKKFEKYNFMTYAVFDVEDAWPDLKHRFDLVLSTNCVHATSSRRRSLENIKQLLNEHGVVILSEGVRIMPWADITFGLLDGWWSGPDYPLQAPGVWMSDFKAAGYSTHTHSQGSVSESNTQCLLLGTMSKKHSLYRAKSPSVSSHRSRRLHKLETLMFKKVDGLELSADIYLPTESPVALMPIALMIHGGGHMTLSRKAIRPAQTAFLLSNGILPISIDYRLCPEINLIDGAMTDIRDAFAWVSTTLPGLLESENVYLDTSRIVVLGWSTGGHLAMTTSWTTTAIGLKPPRAILSFYAPTDFESGELDEPRLGGFPKRTLPLHQIIDSLPLEPITGHQTATGPDSTGQSVVRPGAPRLELIHSLFTESESVGLPLLLNGHPRHTLLRCATATPSDDDIIGLLEHPPTDRIAAISPMAQVRLGTYKTPTYLIHSTEDEVVAFSTAEKFVAALRGRGVRHGLLALNGVKHIHDTELRPGTKEWKEQVEPGYQFLFDMLDLKRT